MLNTDLLEIINSGRAWAFVGSGVSVDAGCPTWEKLVNNILANIPDEKRIEIESQSKFKNALLKKDFPACLSVIESRIERSELEKLVRSELNTTKDMSGKLAQRIASMPFHSYITTNYDPLLEKALDLIKSTGWVAIGNTDDEARKVSGGVEKIIWHIHGAIDMDSNKAKLILTEEDYDSIYVQNSKVKEQLRGVLSQHRIVFIGFSFQDAEVKRILKLVGNLCTPDRPAYAFLSDISGSEHEAERNELLFKYNIRAIPYKTVNGSHKRLHDMFDVYESMILNRALRFGKPQQTAPSYDEEATGLFLYNELNLKKREVFPDSISASLLRARMLSLLRFRGSIHIEDIKSELKERVKLLQSGAVEYDEIDAQIDLVVKELMGSGLINDNEDASAYTLTKTGNELVSNNKAKTELLNDQFYKSLHSKTLELVAENSEINAKNITDAAVRFLKESIKRHALGVALAQENTKKQFQDYQIIALLRSLPDYIGQLSSIDEAKVFIQLIQKILSSPDEIEKKVIGIYLQAQFGVHLLGYNPSTLRIRANTIKETLFLIDSSTLIPFLARSCTGHEAATKVIKLMKACGAAIVTTDHLASEISEHANWAIKHSDNETQTIKSFLAVLGQCGSRSNAFLEGFIEEVTRGTITPFLSEYLLQVCGKEKDSNICRDADIIKALMSYDIPVFAFGQWDGFDKALFADREDIQVKIREKREQYGTFTHDRQVTAEAEALLIIRKFRKSSFKFPDKAISNAYFISNTRIIDQVDGGATNITMPEEAVNSWLSTIGNVDPMELGFLYDGLLWELHDKGFSILDRSKIRNSFSPLIHESKEELQALIETERDLISQVYGADATKAFSKVDDLLAPTVLTSIKDEFNRKLISLRAERKQQKMQEKDRAELEKLRTKEKLRKAKGKSKKRAADNKSKKRKKKKKKN